MRNHKQQSHAQLICVGCQIERRKVTRVTHTPAEMQSLEGSKQQYRNPDQVQGRRFPLLRIRPISKLRLKSRINRDDGRIGAQ